MNLEVETCIGAVSAEISRLTGLYSKWAETHDNPYGIIQVLYVLALHENVTQKQISEICEIPKQTVNSVIKQLKADKHITLLTSKDDKREKKIKLTPLGKTYVQKTLNPFFELNEAAVKRVGIDLLHQLSKGLKTFGDALEMEMELKEVSTKWEMKKGLL